MNTAGFAPVWIALMLGAQDRSLRLDDLRDWTIALPPNASVSERYAAGEFQSLAHQALGVQLTIATAAADRAREIRIGPAALLPGDLQRLNAADPGEEGVYISADPQAIAIAGAGPRGTLYAVYEFWERYAGVRFLTYDHTYIPDGVATATIPCECYTYKPPFSFRWSYYRENTTHQEFAARLRCNTVTHEETLGGKSRQQLIGHSYNRLVPFGVYGKSHPEYFALFKGRRATTEFGEPQICPSNPDVLDIVTKAVLEEIAAHPEQLNFVVSQNDNVAYCQCEKCEAVSRREGSSAAANLAFVNAVAEQVARRYPHVMIGTLAYQYTRHPPKTLKPHRNLQIQLCSIECCTRHAIDDPDCPRNRMFMADLQGWTQLTDNVWTWTYNTNFSELDLPFPNLKGIGHTARCFAQHKVRGVFMQGNGVSLSGEMSDLRNYVISRCLWKPGVDSWALVEEFCRLHYGKAAEPILAYLDMMHDSVDAHGLHPICFCTAPELGITPEVAEKAVTLFDDALNRADNETFRRRVEKASICALKAVVSTHGSYHFDSDGRCRIHLPSGIGERYLALLERHQVSMMTEVFTAEDFVSQMKRHMEGMPYLAIENDVWRVAVVPELNGRVLGLLHKPTGRDLLYNRHRLFTRSRGLEERSAIRVLSGQGRVPAILGHVEDNAVHLECTLDGGTTVRRRICFDPDHSSLVMFRTDVQQAGETSRPQQFSIHPEYDTQSTSADGAVIGIYVHDDQWKQAKGPFDTERGNFDELTGFSGGELAFFNHEAHYGAVMRFDPKAYERLSVWWRPERYQLNLEMQTPQFVLRPGENRSFSYAICFLEQPPIAR